MYPVMINRKEAGAGIWNRVIIQGKCRAIKRILVITKGLRLISFPVGGRAGKSDIFVI